ncbi:MAG: septum formation inhibitor Maf [Wenzhouxiangella sp.]|nr:MAG: septum formation inhibitor Maf [Wenzhouxiangella sp.]
MVPAQTAITRQDSPVILASASPRRRDLLALFEQPFVVVPADIDEARLDDEAATDYVLRIALEKAMAVATIHPGDVVLGSDTAVVLDGQPLGKPQDTDEARSMLRQLSGRCHDVLSAVALVCPDGRRLQRLSTTEVEFSMLPERWIDAYVASGDPMDKAGAYGIQNQAGIWIRRISGSYTGVVGLPLHETGELLREAGLV